MGYSSTRQRLLSILSLLVLTGICLPLLAQDKSAGDYPERGKVIASAASAKASAGGVPVFRIDTENRVYEFEGTDEAKLTVGATIRFRIEADWAYVPQGDKEQKFKVIDTQLKDDD
jgi:hypothetical protein